MMSHSLNNLRWLGLSLLIIGADYLSKALITTSLRLGETHPINSWFNIVLVHNYGVAFSWLNIAGGGQRWLLVGLSLLIVLSMVAWLVSLDNQQPLVSVALALIIGGALGNLFDRVSPGYVVDFLDIHFHAYHWPAFNIADSAIILGSLLLMLSLKK